MASDRVATSVAIGPARMVYLDAVAKVGGLSSRTAALLSIWPRAALGPTAFAAPKLRPVRAPLPVCLRTIEAEGLGICQLSGPEWAAHHADVRWLAVSLAVSLSQVVKAVIDAHADAHGAGVLADA
jgi:hypothetical protein